MNTFAYSGVNESRPGLKIKC